MSDRPGNLLVAGLMGLALAFPFALTPVGALAENNAPRDAGVTSSNWLALKFPQANTDRGQTATSGGGGVRQTSGGSCLTKADLPFQLLIPHDYNQGDGFYNTASKETFIYAYVPPQPGLTAQVQLADPITKDQIQASFPVPKEGGIVRFPVNLPTGAIEDDFYNVTLTLICDANSTEDNLTVELTVNYTPVDQPPSTGDSSLVKASFYAEQGLWLDALNALAAIAKEQPGEWQEFLQSGGFTSWAEAPVVECCQMADKSAVAH
ncbi:MULTISPECIES: DUF928 domain-containing protein [unclassified Synechocystis]|uniref:DUF928 domain-containing protein n=1 Tax=unclassified Synechocystis TaxID=2640012 RepID=UPI00041C5C07|nr:MULTISPECIES: DUF928 domain-containing protein [unclassified Synechocystis]AIE73183.1 Membrane protein related to metalloendopeptidase [Synechocystis sp. PCC 6714]MCT0254302.1 DUF928 domain-containing protein [Synechocystis sp. CS-94]